jgi:phosphoglycerate dehydrogenase-like enzyme
MTINAALIHDYPEGDGAVFGKSQVKRIAALTNLYPEVVNGRNFAEHASALADVQVIFATWGMPAFGERHFAALPDLKAVFYAAGNVKSFAAPLLERGVISATGMSTRSQWPRCAWLRSCFPYAVISAP